MDDSTQEQLEKLFDILTGVTHALLSLGVAPQDILDLVEITIHDEIEASEALDGGAPADNILPFPDAHEETDDDVPI